MKTKILCFLLLLCTLLLPHPAELVAHAAEDKPELKYTKTVDEWAGMKEPQWTFHFNPEFRYKIDLLIFGFGRMEGFKKWNIADMYYSFTYDCEHKNVATVGNTRSDMSLLVEYEFYSQGENNTLLTSTSWFSYPLIDYFEDSGDVSFTFPYADIMNSCDYYTSGLPTVIHSVKLTVYSHILNTCGTSVCYDFEYLDDDFSRQICSGIKYYTYTDSDGFTFIGDNTDLFCESDTSFDYYFYTLVPGSTVDSFIGILRFISSLIIELPNMLWGALKFIISFLTLLPHYMHRLMPFIPQNILTFLMYCIYFSILWGIYTKYKKIKE